MRVYFIDKEGIRLNGHRKVKNTNIRKGKSILIYTFDKNEYEGKVYFHYLVDGKLVESKEYSYDERIHNRDYESILQEIEKRIHEIKNI